MAAAELQKVKAPQHTQLAVQRLLEAGADSCWNDPANKAQLTVQRLPEAGAASCGITQRTRPKQSCRAWCLPDKRTGATEE